MSDQKEVDVLSLEDLFLSREFGQPRVDTLSHGDTLFGNGSSRGPLVPLTAGATAGFGHLTTTHVRRNRTLFAAVSGAAAALLVAVGVLAQTDNPAKPSLAVGGKGGGSTTTTTPTTPPPIGSVPGTVSGTSGNGASGVGLTSFVKSSGGTGATVSTSAPKIVTNPITVVPPLKGPGTAPTKPSSPTPTPTSGNVLTPVVTLVGNAVTTVGATATTASIGLGVTLPVITPVTHIVSSLGGTLTDLGGSLSGTTV